MINFIIGALIIGYAAWTMYKFIQKSKKGKCGACALKSSCSSGSCNSLTDENMKRLLP